jgi:vacuolar iron transporter family protein
MIKLEDYLHKHYIHRSNWLRAAVLGANDGIISVTSIAIGIASANASRQSVILGALAGLVAGALSMAAGEYVSVSSQTDTENADIEREKEELAAMPEEELLVLAYIYEQRGLKKETAMQVAKELSEKDALAAHIRDELGINPLNKANPVQAALASCAAFTLGGIIPLLLTWVLPLQTMEYWLYGSTILLLALLGALSAKIGGSPIIKAVLRISFWGSLAMIISAVVGYLFGVKI